MTHKMIIWSKNKKTGTLMIEGHETITEELINEWFIEKYKDEHEYGLMEDREYWSEIEETTH